MATRFYFANGTGYAADVTPSSWSAGWNKTSGVAADRKLLGHKFAVEAEAFFANVNTGFSGDFTAVRRYISGPLAAQTISGTIKGQFKCAQPNAADSMTLAVAIKIIQADGSDRAALLAPAASDNGTTTPPEMAITTLTNRQFQDSAESASISLTSQSASFGDRLVVEVGMRQSASVATANIQFTTQATQGTADLGENNTDTTALNPWIEFSNTIGFLDCVGSKSTPVDAAAATNTTDPTVVDIDSEITCLAGDLIVMVGQQRATAATLAVSATGGQTWNTLTPQLALTLQSVEIYWCQFNGTWSADPSVDFSAAVCNSVQAFVFRPPATNYNWSVNQALVELDTAGSPATITGQTTTGTDLTVTIAGWFTPDDNTWGSLSGTGWSDLGGGQYRNTSGSDQSATFAYKLQSAAGATGDVTKTQATNGPDAGTTFIITFAASEPVTGSLVFTPNFYFNPLNVR